MRFFWITLAVLALAAAGLMLYPRDSSLKSVTPSAPAVQDRAQPAAEPPPATPAPHPDTRAEGTPETTQDVPKPAEPLSTSDAPESAATTKPAPDRSPKPTPPTATDQRPKLVADPPVEVKPQSESVSSPQAPKPTPDVPAIPDPATEVTVVPEIKPSPVSATGESVVTVAPDTVVSATTTAASSASPLATGPAKLETQDDGSVLVDDRFVMKGKGTKADPYIVTWEQLLSAQETYKPRLGQKNLPDRVKMLDGKWVKINGFVAFPIMAQSQDEMLAMLNQWDGCCIGMPPTPYDAIEVRLKEPAEGEDRLIVTGTVLGKLKVDPYLVKDWLVSLYLMDDATVLK